MAHTNPEAAWDRFQADLKTLREQLAKQKTGPEIQASLETLAKTAEQVMTKLGDAARDPAVRAGTTATARSFGVAVGETLRRIGDDLAQSFRERKP
jgi:ElaB/YqjD/DUF883 family membrane-anchored ribosome-binding protein